MNIRVLLKNEILNLKKSVFAYIGITIATMILQLIVPYVSGMYIDSLVDKHSAIMLFVVAIAGLNLFSYLCTVVLWYDRVFELRFICTSVHLHLCTLVHQGICTFVPQYSQFEFLLLMLLNYKDYGRKQIERSSCLCKSQGRCW